MSQMTQITAERIFLPQITGWIRIDYADTAEWGTDCLEPKFRWFLRNLRNQSRPRVICGKNPFVAVICAICDICG
jgi:hypothetical protein